MNTEFTVDYFIKKFEAIPEENWCINSRIEGNQRCANGWCYQTPMEAFESMSYLHKGNDEEHGLRILIKSLGLRFNAGGINNGIHTEYKQPTPKQRILAALYDIKKTQKPFIEEKTKTVYVAVPTTITEQVSELIMS